MVSQPFKPLSKKSQDKKGEFVVKKAYKNVFFEKTMKERSRPTITETEIQSWQKEPARIEACVCQMLWPWLKVKPPEMGFQGESGQARLRHFLAALEVQYPSVLADNSPYLSERNVLREVGRSELSPYSSVLEALGKVIPGDPQKAVRAVFWGAKTMEFLTKPGSFVEQNQAFLNNPEQELQRIVEARAGFPFWRAYPETFVDQSRFSRNPLISTIAEVAHLALRRWVSYSPERHVETSEIIEILEVEDSPASRWLAERIMMEITQTHLFSPGSVAVSQSALAIGHNV